MATPGDFARAAQEFLLNLYDTVPFEKVSTTAPEVAKKAVEGIRLATPDEIAIKQAGQELLKAAESEAYKPTGKAIEKQIARREVSQALNEAKRLKAEEPMRAITRAIEGGKLGGSIPGGGVNIPVNLGSEVMQTAGKLTKGLGVIGALIEALAPSEIDKTSEDAMLALMKGKGPFLSPGQEAPTAVSKEQKLPPTLEFTYAGSPTLPSIEKQPKQIPVTEDYGDILYRAAKGATTVQAFGGLKAIPQADGSTLIVRPKTITADPVAQARLGEAQVSRAIVGTTANLQGIEDQIKSLEGIDSPETRISKTIEILANIDSSIALIQQRNLRIAESQSGLMDAKAMLQRNIQEDIVTGHRAKYNEASQQTQEAQINLNRAIDAAKNLELSLTHGDPDFARLEGYKKRLAAQENLLARIDARQEAERNKREEKLAAFGDINTKIANYRVMFSTEDGGLAKESDEEIKKIFTSPRVAKDKKLQVALTADKNNIWELLTTSDPVTRNAAWDLALGYERKASLDQGNTWAPVLEKMLSKYRKDPTSILKENPKLATDYATAGAGAPMAEKAAMQNRILSEAIRKKVEDTYVLSSKDMTKWKTNETAPNTPLGIVIQEVAGANNGVAKVEDVIALFISRPVMTSNNLALTPQQKKLLAQQALSSLLAKEPVSYLLPKFDSIAPMINDQIEKAYRKGVNKLFLTETLNNWSMPNPVEFLKGTQ